MSRIGRGVGAALGRKARTSPAQPKLAVIYHPEKFELKKLRPLVEKVLAESTEAWQESIWFETSETATGAKQALDALAQGATQILVVGGDGTLRPVFGAVHNRVSADGKPIVLSLLPAGTGNLLARNLGLPLNQVLTSLRRALLGTVRKLDGAKATLTYPDGQETTLFFSVIAGIGLDATIMMNTDPKLKSRIGWLAYWDAGFKALPLKYERLSVSVDGRPPIHKKVITLLVGNVGFMQLGMALMPLAKLDDGLLDVAAVAPRRFRHWLHFWSRITWETWVLGSTSQGRWILDKTKDIKTLEQLSGKVIEVEGEGPVNLQVDGDAFGAVSKVRFEVLPQSMHLRL